jgi:hypothetical protein
LRPAVLPDILACGMTSRIDIAEIQKAALRSIPLTFRLTSLPHESHALLDRILEVYLEELGQEKILEPLSYCLKELIINAQKANTKRLYFQEKGLDILNEQDYETGMRDFRRESAERLEHWLGQLKEKGLVIGVTFHTTGGSLAISVRNSAELTHGNRRAYSTGLPALVLFTRSWRPSRSRWIHRRAPAWAYSFSCSS